jgi:hypothetical protein
MKVAEVKQGSAKNSVTQINARQSSTEDITETITENTTENITQNTYRRNISLDIFVVIVCLTGVAAGLFLFWQDLNTSLTKQSEESVGTIRFKKNAAQRRFSDHIIWDRLQKESPIYNGDTIRTADLSEATVIFNNGDKIDVSETTLIQIISNKDGNRVVLNRGNVNAASERGGLDLEIGGSSVKVGTGSTVSAVAKNGVNISVLEGNAVLKTSAGIEDISGGESIAMREDGVIENVQSVTVVSPAPNLKILNPSQESQLVDFAWKASNLSVGDQVCLEIARDRNFNTMAASVKENTSRNSAQIPLANGVYFFRAYPINAEGSANEDAKSRAMTQKLTLLYAPPTTLILPANNAVIKYREQNPQVRFQWTAATDTDRYRIEIAPSATMDNLAFDRIVQDASEKTASFLFSGLNAGRWYWRASPVYEDDVQGNVLAPVPAVFNIEQTIGDPEEPFVMGPADGAFLSNAAGNADAYFSWRKEPEAASYTIVISQDKELRDPIVRQTKNENFFSYNLDKSGLANGTYYWAVRQTDSLGGSSRFSPVRSFVTGPTDPREKIAAPVAAVKMTAQPVALSLPPNGASIAGIAAWRRPDIARWSAGAQTLSSSRFVLSRNRNPLSGGILMDIANPPQDVRLIKLSAGVYYWMVQAETTEGDAITSPVFSFTVTPVDIPKLQLQSPGQDARFTEAEFHENPPHVRWTSSEPVGSSRFILSRNQNLSGASIMNIQNPARDIPLQNLPPGDYYWTVRATTSDDLDISPAVPAVFHISRTPPLPAPLGRLPADGARITAEDIVKNSQIEFTWDAVPGANAYNFVLYEMSDAANRTTAANRILIARSDGDSQRRNLVDGYLFKNGAYMWQVEAVRLDENGNIAHNGISGENHFTVEIPIPGSPRPNDPGMLYGRPID